MKKRKELDALVTNGKLGKRNKITSTLGHELLRHDTDTSDMEDFSILQPRKRHQKSGMPTRICATCFPLCLFLLITACVAASATLVWLHFGLRKDMDRFRAHLQKVEAESEGTPETLHSIHSHLKSLHTDITLLENKFVKATSDIASLTQEVDHLKQIANNLKASVAAAPEIQTLPKNVEYLTESVANIGSKITALETTSKDMKTDYSGLKTSTETLSSQMDVVKAKLDEVKAKQQLAVAATSIKKTNSGINEAVASHLQEEMRRMMNTVDKMNSTFTVKLTELNNLPLWFEAINRSMLWAVDDLHQHHTKLNQLYAFVYDNLTIRLENVETKWENGDFVKSSQRLVNQTVTEAMNDVIKDAMMSNHPTPEAWRNTMNDIHHLVVLYLNILQQINNSNENHGGAKQQLFNVSVANALLQGNKIQTSNNTIDKFRNQFLALENFVRKVDRKIDERQYSNFSQTTSTIRTHSIESRFTEQSAKENYSTPGSFSNQHPPGT